MPSNSVLVGSVPHRALVVDDESGVCAMLAAQLTNAGWDAVMATRISEARLAIEDRTKTIDMVFLDLRLPDGDGMDLIPLIEERRDKPDVVIVTGYHDEETLVKAIRHGVLDILFKPFTLADVAVVLRRWAIRERRQLGLTYDRFERVDQEFATVHRELADLRSDIRSILDGWAEQQPFRARTAGGSQS